MGFLPLAIGISLVPLRPAYGVGATIYGIEVDTRAVHAEDLKTGNSSVDFDAEKETTHLTFYLPQPFYGHDPDGLHHLKYHQIDKEYG